jgi:hypothetical protein
MRLVFAVILALAAAGCAGIGKGRSHYGDTVTQLSVEVAKLPPSNEKTRLEALVDSLEVQKPSASRLDRKTAAQLARLEAFAAAAGAARIDLGFATDGKDWSGKGADDGVEVHLIPRDGAASAVKCPGSVEVTLYEKGRLELVGLGTEIDRWVISTDTLMHSWNESLFPGYVVQLPWHETPPNGGPAVLAVTFTPLYGPPLEARKEIEIHRP